MACAAVKIIRTEVDDIAALPTATRSAASIPIRRRMWAIVGELQHASEPGNAFWHRCQKQETIKTCISLRPLVFKLQYLDLSSCGRTSSWLLTDYTALSKEITAQHNLAEKFLSTSEDWEIDDDDDPSFQVICGCRWSGNMRVLALTALLFMTITGAQTMGAFISNSAALLADCITMAVDSSTYFLNMLAECQKGTRFHRWLQLLIPVVSLSVLIYLTVGVMKEAVGTLDADGDDDDDDVNPYIVFGFGICGLVFDVFSLCAFVRNQKKNAEQAGINMMAAFAHVAADFARSTTTSVESIFLFVFTTWNGTVIDAWACLVVSVIILCGAVYSLIEWGREVLSFFRTGE